MTTLRTLFLPLLTLLAALGCGNAATQDERGDALATLGGSLRLAPDATVDGPIRLAVVWYTDPSEGTSLFPRPSAVVSPDVTYQGNFPLSFTFGLHAPPPAVALGGFEGEDGSVARGALGSLVAYQDRNGNGTLDTIPLNGEPIDFILASSLHSQQLPAYTLLYLQDAHAPSGTAAGFHLYRHDDAQTASVVPVGTPMQLTLDPRPSLNWAVCLAQGISQDDTPCGITPDPDQLPNDLRVDGDLELVGDHLKASIGVMLRDQQREDAVVLLNGTRLELGGGGYTNTFGTDSGGWTLKAGDPVRLVVSVGGEETQRVFTLPAAPTILAPTPGASVACNAPLTVSWSPVTGTNIALVTVEKPGDWIPAARSYMTGRPPDTSYTFDAGSVACVGAARLRVGVGVQYPEPMRNGWLDLLHTAEQDLTVGP